MREINSGGGLLVYVKNGVGANRITDLEHEIPECIWPEIKLVQSKPFFLNRQCVQTTKLEHSIECSL